MSALVGSRLSMRLYRLRQPVYDARKSGQAPHADQGNDNLNGPAGCHPYAQQLVSEAFERVELLLQIMDLLLEFPYLDRLRLGHFLGPRVLCFECREDPVRPLLLEACVGWQRR